MPSIRNVLSAAMLASLLQCAYGAPVTDALTYSPAGDPSGEEDVTSPDSLSALDFWDTVHFAAGRLQNVFEFPSDVKNFLRTDKIPFPENCPYSNLRKEACLHKLVEGLLRYTVLLKHVEKEYPSSSIPSEVLQIRGSLSMLIREIKKKMRDSNKITELSSSQEEQLLKDIDDPDTFHRKMTALTILSKLRDFIADGKRAVRRREMAPVS